MFNFSAMGALLLEHYFEKGLRALGSWTDLMSGQRLKIYTQHIVGTHKTARHNRFHRIRILPFKLEEAE